MAEFEKVMNERKRMCNSYDDCDDCFLSPGRNGKQTPCYNFSQDYPKEAEDIIMNWAITHPVKTNLEEFCEHFGVAKEDIQYEKIIIDKLELDIAYYRIFFKKYIDKGNAKLASYCLNEVVRLTNNRDNLIEQLKESEK